MDYGFGEWKGGGGGGGRGGGGGGNRGKRANIAEHLLCSSYEVKFYLHYLNKIMPPNLIFF